MRPRRTTDARPARIVRTSAQRRDSRDTQRPTTGPTLEKALVLRLARDSIAGDTTDRLSHLSHHPLLGGETNGKPLEAGFEFSARLASLALVSGRHHHFRVVGFSILSMSLSLVFFLVLSSIPLAQPIGVVIPSLLLAAFSISPLLPLQNGAASLSRAARPKSQSDQIALFRAGFIFC